VTEKELARKREEKLCFRYSESGHKVQNCSYLLAKRPTALTEAGNKKKATKVAAISNKKAAWPQVEKVSDSEPASASDSENE